MRNLRALSLALALLGVFSVTLLVAWTGAAPIADSALSVGWSGLGILCVAQVATVALLGFAWQQVAVSAPGRSPLWPDWRYVWARLVRDATACCLPFSQLGGFAIGVRALVLTGAAWPVASATMIGDMTAEFLAEILFALAGGIVVLARTMPSLGLSPLVEAGLLALIVIPGLVVLPYRAAPVCARLAGGIARRGLGLEGDRLNTVDGELALAYGRVDGFAASTALHFLGWIAKGAGGWLAFRYLGAPIGFVDALAIEAVLHAALAVAFFIPGYLGVQEAGYILLGGVFGLPPELALGASFLRRGRDVALGIPVLLGWQWSELGRLRHKRG